MSGLRLVLVGIVRILSLAAPLVSIGPGGASALESETEIPLLTEALLSGDFALLEEKFTAWQSAYEEGTGSEWTVVENFRTFSSSNPEFEDRLNEWMEQYPHSFVAPTARAHYFARLNAVARGSLNAATIPDDRLSDLESWHRAAVRDYTTALERNDKLTVAYAGLIYEGKISGDGATIDRVYEKGWAVYPDSVVIHDAYLGSLWPYWNPRPGSFE